MADDLLPGRVTSFRREQGFGVITLDDGRAVKFDASACTMVPEEGASVRLRVGPARWGGGVKALHVEPRTSSTLFAPGPTSTLDQQIAALQREHLVAALSEHVMGQLVAEVFDGQIGDATLIDVIDAFYVEDPARAQHDGYLRHDVQFGQETDDVLAEIAAIVPGVALPRQLSWTSRTAELGSEESVATLHVQLPDGSEHGLDVASLDDIVGLVNEVLRTARDPRRLFAMQTDGGWHAYFALPIDRARRLANVLPFSVPPRSIE